MRSAARISRTPREYAAHAELERRRALREVLELLERARLRAEPWYQWIVDGRPELTQAEYDATMQRRRR